MPFPPATVVGDGDVVGGAGGGDWWWWWRYRFQQPATCHRCWCYLVCCVPDSPHTTHVTGVGGGLVTLCPAIATPCQPRPVIGPQWITPPYPLPYCLPYLGWLVPVGWLWFFPHAPAPLYLLYYCVHCVYFVFAHLRLVWLFFGLLFAAPPLPLLQTTPFICSGCPNPQPLTCLLYPRLLLHGATFAIPLPPVIVGDCCLGATAIFATHTPHTRLPSWCCPCVPCCPAQRPSQPSI